MSRLLLSALCLCLSAITAEADGDAEAGAVVFRKCGACHTATEPTNRVGPSLLGIINRPVATAPDYSYSSAMTEFGADGKVWDEVRLAEYLLAPKAMVPGTKMAFAGLKKPTDIANVVAYLKSVVAPK